MTDTFYSLKMSFGATLKICGSKLVSVAEKEACQTFMLHMETRGSQSLCVCVCVGGVLSITSQSSVFL